MWFVIPGEAEHSKTIEFEISDPAPHSFLLSVATNFTVGIKISQHRSDLFLKKKQKTKTGALGLLSPLLVFVRSKAGLWRGPCHSSKSNDISIRNQRKRLVAGHPGFSGIWRARESVSWTTCKTTLAFPIINFKQATNLPS